MYMVFGMAANIYILFLLIYLIIFGGKISKRLKRYVIFFFPTYTMIFILFFPVSRYGLDSYRLLKLKKCLVSESYENFKEITSREKILKEKIKYSRHIFYEVENAKKEMKLFAEALQNTEGVKKEFIPIRELENMI
jgi:hypothetical protein